MRRAILSILCLLAMAFSTVRIAFAASLQQPDNPSPPDHVVKLVFIHHSTGGNWLASPSENDLGGDLGRALMENNYYVSATNYGWGPDSIGDSTDIPNWLDWFRGENSATYLDALYHESSQNSGDFGSWPRLPNDPGGENEIILFKSCFPNSDLEGSPDDPPDPEGWLSVGHAKYVYNEILKYFATRPDKLFVVITAPPLTPGSTAPEHAANARAFNQWLMNDWLAENDYTLPNVAVFDFYNVLTGPENHHRFFNGEIQHVFVEGMNTEYYPSGDDHPSAEGNRKATEEFVPLLNIFYHRWADSGSVQPPAATQPPLATAETPLSPVSPATPSQPVSFATYWDETTATRITCGLSNDQALSPPSSLKIDFDVVAGSWSTCVLTFNGPQDWGSGPGLSFALHANATGIPYDVLLYAGSPDNRETYVNYEETPQDSAGAWATVQIPWNSFKRADWEADAGTIFDKPGQIAQIAFGFDGGIDANNGGTIWIDDIHLIGGAVSPTAESPTSEPNNRGSGLPCLGGALLPLALVGAAWILRKR